MQNLSIEEREACLVLTSNLPRFGLSFPAKILRAVDFPIPFVPTNPRTWPGLGTGSLCNLKALDL